MTTSYNKDDLESVLRYLTGEYGIEILAGQGSIPGKHDIMRLLPDFFSTKHKGDYSMMSMMVHEGTMTKLLSLRESGTYGNECRRLVAIETQKLTDNFIPQEIASKYVNMIAGIMGLEVPAVAVQAAPTPKQKPVPKPKTQPAAKPKSQPTPKPKPKRPAMSDEKFVKLCEFGTAKEVEEALENGANPNAKNNDGRTALLEAVGNWNADAAEVLLKHGADVNARDNKQYKEGMTALCIASDYESVALVEVLLKYGADVNAKDDYGYTALMYAACDRNDDDSSSGKVKQAILEALLRHGADINAQNGEGGRTALHLAVQNGRLAAVKVLLKHGANVNIEDDDGETPLDCVPYGSHWLASEFINEIADALRNPKRYADTGRNSVNDYDFLELCESGTARAVEEALQHGANINARDDSGWTALFLAAIHKHADVVEVLLRHGANVNARNYEGKTALHEAAYWGKADVAEILLKHGADINAKDNDGKTALDIAQQEGHSDVVKVLRSKDTRSLAQPAAKPKRPAMSDWEFVELCRSGSAREVDEALQNGANVNAVDKFGNLGWRALHWAACEGHADVIEVLLKHGANVNAKDNDGWRALHWAAKLEHADVVEVLLKHGADVNARDDRGWTALHVAGNADVAEILLQHGADINAKDNDGKTALYFAQRNGCSNVVALLRAKDPGSAKDTRSFWSRLFS